jgi:GntR family transcriptional repressor for pyruvate dehydrogenase complex
MTAVPLGPEILLRSTRRRNLKTSERIARDIANYIVDADLPEGARLPREKEMLEMMGVGRMTLREALRLLETQGVIDIRSGAQGGPVVRRPQAEDLAGNLTLVLQFHHASLADVMLARQALEPVIARLAAEHVTDAQVEELQQTIDLMRHHPESAEVFLRENERFHQLVAEASGSVSLRVFSATLKSIASGEDFGIEYQPEHRQAVAKAHSRILTALRNRRPAAAEKAMLDHLGEAAVYWQRRYPELWARPVRWIQP